jgi:hypothetical protein
MRVRFPILFSLLYIIHLGVPLLFAAPSSSVTGPSEINEASGIVKSRKYPDIFWAHNDSGDTARIFAVRGDGQLAAIVQIDGAENVDWEDISMGEPGQIYICDIGDNRRNRNDLSIYLIPEPNPETDEAVEVIRKINFGYQSLSNGKPVYFDAEACFFASGNLYILTKSEFQTELYRLNVSEEETVAEKISTLPIKGRVTGADVSPDRKKLAVLTYLGIHIFEKPKGSDNYLAGSHQVLEQFFGQAEGIAFDKSALVITNEEGQILKVPYP